MKSDEEIDVLKAQVGVHFNKMNVSIDDAAAEIKGVRCDTSRVRLHLIECTTAIKELARVMQDLELEGIVYPSSVNELVTTTLECVFVMLSDIIVLEAAAGTTPAKPAETTAPAPTQKWSMN